MKRMMLVVSVLALLLPASIFVGAPIASASCGGDFQQMTAAAFSTPGPPQDLTVFPGNRDVVLFWNAPESDGGGIDFYTVYVNEVPKFSTSETQAQVNKLANGQTYSFHVTASNDCGESAPSNTVTATPSKGQGAELIGGGNLSMSTGGDATAADPFVGKQTFPAGTTGLGRLDEEPDNGFCGGPCLAGEVLVNSLQNGSLGGPFYTVRLIYDQTALQASTSATLAASVPTSFTVYYDATKGESPIQLPKCSVAPVPCVQKITRDDGDLIVPVRTDDLDPRLGTR
jgi:Fibronectin type III domain